MIEGFDMPTLARTENGQEVSAYADDPLPDGIETLDPSNPHHRYNWMGWYDDVLTGPMVQQLDRAGRVRAAGLLDGARLVRLHLLPRWDGLPAVEVRAHRGERIRKYWQIDHEVNGGARHIRDVVALDRMIDGQQVSTYLVIDEDGALRYSTTADW